MRLLTGFSEIVGVVMGLCMWGLVPDLLWDHGYNFLAALAFIVIPYCLFYLVHCYGEWQRGLLHR
jgi:hypothetical protein